MVSIYKCLAQPKVIADSIVFQMEPIADDDDDYDIPLLGQIDKPENLDDKCFCYDVADVMAIRYAMTMDDEVSFSAFCDDSPRTDQRWFNMMLRRALRTVHRPQAPSGENNIVKYLLDKIVAPLDLPTDENGSFLIDAVEHPESRRRPGNRLRLLQLLMSRGARPTMETGGKDVFDIYFGPRRSPYRSLERGGFRLGSIARLFLSWKSNALMHLARATFRNAVRKLVLGRGGDNEQAPQNIADLTDLVIARHNRVDFQMPDSLRDFCLENENISRMVDNGVLEGELRWNRELQSVMLGEKTPRDVAEEMCAPRDLHQAGKEAQY